MRLNCIIKHWQAAGKKIPPGFKERVRRAEALFFYHPVYDPISRSITHFCPATMNDTNLGGSISTSSASPRAAPSQSGPPMISPSELYALGNFDDITSGVPEGMNVSIADICEGILSRADFTAIEPILPWEIHRIANLTQRVSPTMLKSSSWSLRRNLSSILRDQFPPVLPSSNSNNNNSNNNNNNRGGGANSSQSAGQLNRSFSIHSSTVTKQNSINNLFEKAGSAPISLMKSSSSSLLFRSRSDPAKAVSHESSSIVKAAHGSLNSLWKDDSGVSSKTTVQTSGQIKFQSDAPCQHDNNRGSTVSVSVSASASAPVTAVNKDSEIFNLVSDDDEDDSVMALSEAPDSVSFMKDDDFYEMEYISSSETEEASIDPLEVEALHTHTPHSPSRKPLAVISSNVIDLRSNSVETLGKSKHALTLGQCLSAESPESNNKCANKIETSAQPSMTDSLSQDILGGMCTPPFNREFSNSSFVDCLTVDAPAVRLLDTSDAATCMDEAGVDSPLPGSGQEDGDIFELVSKPSSLSERSAQEMSSGVDVDVLLTINSFACNPVAVEVLCHKRKASEMLKLPGVLINADPKSKRKKTGKTMTVASIKSFFSTIQ